MESGISRTAVVEWLGLTASPPPHEPVVCHALIRLQPDTRPKGWRPKHVILAVPLSSLLEVGSVPPGSGATRVLPQSGDEARTRLHALDLGGTVCSLVKAVSHVGQALVFVGSNQWVQVSDGTRPCPEAVVPLEMLSFLRLRKYLADPGYALATDGVLDAVGRVTGGGPAVFCYLGPPEGDVGSRMLAEARRRALPAVRADLEPTKVGAAVGSLVSGHLPESALRWEPSPRVHLTSAWLVDTTAKPLAGASGSERVPWALPSMAGPVRVVLEVVVLPDPLAAERSEEGTLGRLVWLLPSGEQAEVALQVVPDSRRGEGVGNVPVLARLPLARAAWGVPEIPASLSDAIRQLEVSTGISIPRECLVSPDGRAVPAVERPNEIRRDSADRGPACPGCAAPLLHGTLWCPHCYRQLDEPAGWRASECGPPQDPEPCASAGPADSATPDGDGPPGHEADPEHPPLVGRFDLDGSLLTLSQRRSLWLAYSVDHTGPVPHLAFRSSHPAVLISPMEARALRGSVKVSLDPAAWRADPCDRCVVEMLWSDQVVSAADIEVLPPHRRLWHWGRNR